MSTEDYSMPVVVLSIAANKSKRGLQGKCIRSICFGGDEMGLEILNFVCEKVKEQRVLRRLI